MKYYFFTWFTDTLATSCVMQSIDNDLNLNIEITLITCNGGMKGCWKNPAYDNEVCKKCKFWKKSALNKYKNKIKTVEIDDYIDKHSEYIIKNVVLKDCSLDAIKKLYINNAWIGWGAYSTYVSITKCSNPFNGKEMDSYFNCILYSSLALSYGISNFIKKNKQCKNLVLFNGRTADTRPVYDNSIYHKINIDVLEVERYEDYYRGVIFKNALPQDSNYQNNAIQSFWDGSDENIKNRIMTSKKFYMGRRLGLGTCDVQSWIKNQKNGLLPESWNNRKFNIVYFTSSDFEVAGVKEVQDDSAFSSQYNAIIETYNIIKTKKNYVLTIRIHPNQENGNDTIVNDLKKYFYLSNDVNIIDSNSNVCSYALMKNANIVITHTSTTGIEAAYLKKMVLITGSTFYDKLGSVVKVRDNQDLIRLLNIESKLLKRSGCAKYGYWIMSTKLRSFKINYYPYQLSFFKKKFVLFHNGYDILHSSVVFWLAEKLLFKRVN